MSETRKPAVDGSGRGRVERGRAQSLASVYYDSPVCQVDPPDWNLRDTDYQLWWSERHRFLLAQAAAYRRTCHG